MASFFQPAKSRLTSSAKPANPKPSTPAIERLERQPQPHLYLAHTLRVADLSKQIRTQPGRRFIQIHQVESIRKLPQLVNTGIDLWPTLAGYAGLAGAGGYPGLNLKDAHSRQYVVVADELAQGAPVHGQLLKPTGRMLRSQRYKYCVYSQGNRRESLVDLEKDPGEMVNLADDPKLAGILASHRQWLSAWCKQYNDPFPVIT